MAVPYPLGLRTVLSASKTRTQPASFSLHEPRRGYGYARELGTDVPVFWDVSFRFTPREAIIFRLWFTQTLRRGVEEFTLPIRTEFGVITYTCRFLPEGLMPTRQEGGTWTYSATVMARAEVIPADYLGAADLIVGLMPDWEGFASMLDQTMTGAMPQP